MKPETRDTRHETREKSFTTWDLQPATGPDFSFIAHRLSRFFLFVCLASCVLCPSSQVSAAVGVGAMAEQRFADDLAIAAAHARAFHYYSLGAAEQAIREWEWILRVDPQNGDALSMLRKTVEEVSVRQAAERVSDDQRRGVVSSTLRRLELAGLERPGQARAGAGRFEQRTFLGTYKRRAGDRSDRTLNGPWGYYGAESIMWQDPQWTPGGSLSAEWDYFNRQTEDLRLRQATYTAENGPWRYVIGDTSTKLSRYVVRGVSYRGIDARLSAERGDLQMLYGATPVFVTDKEEYIYPRQILGLRGSTEIGEGQELGLSFSHLNDSSRIHRVNSTNPKESMVVGLDHRYQVIPGRWTIGSELAFSSTDPNTDNGAADDLSGSAQYLTSNVSWERVGWSSRYERIGHGFRSLLGLSETAGSLNPVTADRQEMGTTLEVRPNDTMRIDFDYSDYRSNLDGRSSVEGVREHRYGSRWRWDTPDPWPHLLTQVVWTDRLSVPGNVFQSNHRSGWDNRIELAKSVDINQMYRDIDLRAAYVYRESLDSLTTPLNELTEQRYELRGVMPLSERVRFNSLWAFSRLFDEVSTGDRAHVADQWLVNLSLASRLWDTASLTLGYEPLGHDPSPFGTRLRRFEDAQTYEATFRWPWARSFQRGRKLSISPYLSFFYENVDSATAPDRTFFSSRLETAFELHPDHRLGFDLEYRDGHSEDDALLGTKEFRMMLVYRGGWDIAR